MAFKKIAGDKRCWKFSLVHRIHSLSWLLFSHGSEIYPLSHSVCQSFFSSHRFIYLINKLLARFSVTPFEDFICLADSQVTTHKFSIQAFHSTLAEDRKDWTTWAEGRTYVPAGSPNPDGMNKPTAETQRERERKGLVVIGCPEAWSGHDVDLPRNQSFSLQLQFPSLSVKRMSQTLFCTHTHTHLSPYYSAPQVLTACLRDMMHNLFCYQPPAASFISCERHLWGIAFLLW